MSNALPKDVDWENLRVAPWERLPRESSKSFAYFQAFRDTPSTTRTLSGVARELGIRRESLTEHAVKWHWRHRIELWDQYLDAVARHEQEQAIKEMNSRHARTAMVILQRVGQRLVGDEAAGIQAMDVNKLNPSDLARLTEVATKVERLALGAESERIGVSTSEELTVKIAFDTEPVYPDRDPMPVEPAVEAVEGSGFVEIEGPDEE